MSNNYKNDNTYLNNFPRSEKVIIFAICVSLAFVMVDSLINRVLLVEFWDSLVTKSIYYGSLLWGTYYALHRLKKEMLLIPFLFLVLWLSSYWAFPVNRSTLNEIIIPFITIHLPLFIITRNVKDFVRLYKALRNTSIIVIICALIYFTLQSKGQISFGYMEFAYSMSFSVLFLLVIAFQYRNKVDIIMSLIGLIILFISGARGALFGVLLGMFFVGIINLRLTSKNIILITPLLFLVFIISNKYLIWLGSINKVLQTLNINSRTINMILSNEIESSSGRDLIFEKAISFIQDNPIVGSGMGGDRAILKGYTHNLFTEIGIHYGVFLGAIFIILLLFLLFKALFVKIKDERYYIFFVVFFSTGFMELMFSSSYLLEPTFFMMIALAINIIRKKSYKAINTSN